MPNILVSKLLSLWRNVRSSYWFIPSLMALCAIALALATRRLDEHLGADWLRSAGILLANHPEGARAVLATIAGSMITVAGVTFSMTIVSVSFAAAQFGPRLVGNFMRDTGNQLTLGVFIATFVYSLMTLSTVRSGAAAADENSLAAFVPILSMIIALVLALACIAVLIYYIHHIPETINIGNITAGVGRQLKADIADMFPVASERSSSDGAEDPRDDPWESYREDAIAVRSSEDGYIESVSLSSLVACAEENDLVIRLQYRPGDFSTAGDSLLHASPSNRVSSEVETALRGSFIIGRERTPTQNIIFLVDELIEILARALSPGVNDPFTAFACMHWLRGGLAEMSRRQPPSPYLHDENEILRLIVHPISFERFASAVIDQSLQYVSADRNAALEMLRLITEVATITNNAGRRQLLLEHAERLADAANEQLKVSSDRKAIRDRFEQAKEAIGNAAYQEQLRDEAGWLGGRA